MRESCESPDTVSSVSAADEEGGPADEAGAPGPGWTLVTPRSAKKLAESLFGEDEETPSMTSRCGLRRGEALAGEGDLAGGESEEEEGWASSLETRMTGNLEEDGGLLAPAGTACFVRVADEGAAVQGPSLSAGRNSSGGGEEGAALPAARGEKAAGLVIVAAEEVEVGLRAW